jgi:hypothetical protein
MKLHAQRIDVGCRILHFMNCILIYGALGKKAIFRGIIKNSVSWHLLVQYRNAVKPVQTHWSYTRTWGSTERVGRCRGKTSDCSLDVSGLNVVPSASSTGLHTFLLQFYRLVTKYYFKLHMSPFQSFTHTPFAMTIKSNYRLYKIWTWKCMSR